MPLLLLVSCMSAPGAPLAPEPAPSEARPPGPTGSGAQAAAPPPEARPAPERLVAIGDLHGDLTSALAVLRLTGLVDATGAWAGGNAWLVQTGDITDRGPDSRGVIALMRRLQAEARAAGGEVVPLLGNHEVMNLNGDWRYVSPEDLASYGGEAARKAAYAPTGDDGAWLLAQDGVARIGDTVFAHGGVDARWARLGVRGLNATIRAALLGQGPPEVLGSDGPLWNRTYLLSDPSPPARSSVVPSPSSAPPAWSSATPHRTAAAWPSAAAASSGGSTRASPPTTGATSRRSRSAAAP